MKKVGQILNQARLEKGLELEEASQELKIQKKFLKALEESNYQPFDSVVHIKGFLRNYSEFLGIKPEELLAFWRREFNEKEYKSKTKQLPEKPLKQQKTLITPAIVTIGGIIIVTLGFFSYLFLQYRSLTGPPKLEIEYPNDNARISEKYINAQGVADTNTKLFINEQQVNLNENGRFNVPLALSTGLNTIIFTAKNEAGGNREVIRTVFVIPQQEQQTAEKTRRATASAERVSKQDAELNIKIKADPETVWLEVKTEGQTLFQGMLIAGAELEFSSNKKITIKTGNAGSTQIILNNEDLGTIGEEGRVVEKEFTP